MDYPKPSWLKDAVFYEIYPQTFYDTNGDGIGDIQGIIRKLDYVRSLGINAIWLNPCFDSPFGDAGYDVRDFYRVAPRYGTNEDLRQLFQEAHKRDMRVVLDLVAGHTSIEHPWFIQSSRHERNPYSDWFVWTDSVWTTPPGKMTVISGMAERNASFLPNFFYFQPALNYGFAHPDPSCPWQLPVDAPGPQAVRAEMKKIMEFWLDMGADGYRVDMASSLVKNDPDFSGVSEYWHAVRTWMNETYPDAVLISEWSNPTLAIPAGFHIDFYIHFNQKGYTSLFRRHQGIMKDAYQSDGIPSFFDRQGAGNIYEFLHEYVPHFEKTRDIGYIAIPSGNHDISPRLADNRDLRDLELVYLFLLTLPGIPFIYYGDEIGMRSVEGLPSKEGGYERTAVRTPMQWDSTANAGFSTAAPDRLYLPVDPSPDCPTVERAEKHPDSLLNTVRRLIDLRKAYPALGSDGDIEFAYAKANRYPLIYRRQAGGQTIWVALNPSERTESALLPVDDDLASATPIYGEGCRLTKTGDSIQIDVEGRSGCVLLGKADAWIKKS